MTVRTEVDKTDKPWITVDQRNHDVYLCYQTILPANAVYLSVAQDGNISAQNWSKITIRSAGDSVSETEEVIEAAISMVAVDWNHMAYVTWLESRSVGSRRLQIAKVSGRGTTVDAISTITPVNGLSSIYLARSNSQANDTFTVSTMPWLIANPIQSKAGHLYVVYTDDPSDPSDKSDVFFLRSTDGGATWDNGAEASGPLRLNSNPNCDQWMPTVVVHPAGTKLFVTWYDRRDDANNGMIHLYGRFGTICGDSTGHVTFGPELRITTESFPQVFAGLANGAGDKDPGNYDPVYPPQGVTLEWFYPEWPHHPEFQELYLETDGNWAGHVGEYNGTFADANYVYVSWTDARLADPNNGRKQRDIRVSKLSWPQ